MKQKYSILKNDEHKQLIIREFAELDKDSLSLLCEEAYDDARIKSAISIGKDRLISTLRTNNLYPPGIYADKIADAVMVLYRTKETEPIELFFDDIELLTKEHDAVGAIDQVGSHSKDLEELLEDDYDESFDEDKSDIKKMDSSLKIADDEYVDVDDDS